MNLARSIQSALLTLALTGGTHSASATDLLEAYQLAQENDMAYAAAYSRWSATLEKLPQAKALLRPSAELSGSVSSNHTDTEYHGATFFPGGAQQYSANSYTLSVRQPLYRKQDWVQLDQAQLQISQADARLADAAQTLILRVAQAYLDVLGAQDDLSYVESQKTAITEQLAQAKRQFELGTSTITDANEAQARFDLASAQAIAARSALKIRQSALRQILGTVPASLSRLADTWRMTPPQPDGIEWWEGRAREANPSVLVQASALEIAAREIERQRAGHYPTADLVASYQADSSNGSATFGSGSDSSSAILGLQLKLPLYSGGATDSRVREALRNRDASRQDLENARRNAALDSNQAFLGVTDGLSQVYALEQAVVSSESSLASSRRGWQVGIRTSIDVLNAQQQLYGARRDLTKARYDTIMSLLRLRAATGQLDQQTLAEVNQWLK